ncbi:MAG: hypothetical protein ACKN9T_07300 [Candidatus Methylumidiphilus sp.]
MKFVVCLEKQSLGDFSGEDVTVGKLYEIIDEDAGHGMSRIIDESGEDYLYPSAWFEPVAIDESIARRLHNVLAKIAA